MVRLTFYGGVGRIGGNKVLLEDSGCSLFLDFGFPYGEYRDFYEEYMKPRAGAGLLDLLVMGLLPPLEGIYRTDLEADGLWQRFRDDKRYRRVENVEGVLLSHAHLDHSGHASFLKDSIPVYSTAATAFIAKAIQDSGKSEFDQQVCYFTPTAWQCPSGWKQAAHVTGNLKQQRRFCIADRKPETLSPEASRFWQQGFYDRTSRQKELASFPLEGYTHCSFGLRSFSVDHSIPGACAWGIETRAGWVIYSGDLRLHGKRGQLTETFIEEAAKLRPEVLIIEGTNVDKKANISELQVYENALKAISASKGLVIADFSARDVDRILTFLQVAKDTHRKLAILPRDAYLLKTVGLLYPEIPDLAGEDSFVLYQETTASKGPALWQRNIFEEYAGETVLASDVASNQGDFILSFSFFDLNELPSICPAKGSLYVYSSSEPHNEEQELDFQRLHNWLRHFGIRGFGLPIEKNGGWEVPEEERGLHASGHACGPDLLRIAREIRPKVLIPVHSEKPEFYVNNLSGSEIDVQLPDKDCGTVEV